MIYDPEARRETALALKLKARIRRSGPITVRDYMAACLQDPEHGYYRTRTAIGRDGDFITAPEISQVFGELIGLWCVVVWQQMGSPAHVNVIEAGPGRGTLMRDALRAARVVPAFGAACDIILVETNAVLIAHQKAVLQAHARPVSWYPHLAEVPTGPAIVLANEFLDALPVAQFVRAGVGWTERGVGLDAGGALIFCALEDRPLLLLPAVQSDQTRPGAIFERRQTSEQSFALHRLAHNGPMAALFIDYGHLEGATGDTLQAVRAQRFEHALTSPGEADLTAHVDFAQVAQEARMWGLAVDSPVTQAEFLGHLGIAERASRLMAANPAKATAIEAGVARLMAPNGMGGRFKAIGLRSSTLPPLPGFAVMDKSPRAK